MTPTAPHQEPVKTPDGGELACDGGGVEPASVQRRQPAAHGAHVGRVGCLGLGGQVRFEVDEVGTVAAEGVW
jgi:hypothetical protein